MGEQIQRLRIGAQWLTLLLGAALIARFGWIAVSTVSGTPSPGPERPRVRAPEPSPTQEPAPELPPDQPPDDTKVRVMLSVSYSKGPASVYVNGQPMGQAAFVGEFYCERGDELTIRIEPTRGAPIEGVRACVPGFIVVSE